LNKTKTHSTNRIIVARLVWNREHGMEPTCSNYGIMEGSKPRPNLMS